MLILTRRIGESIIIGDGENKVVITVVSIKGAQAKVGIQAPKDIAVHREEIYEKIKEQTTSGEKSKDKNDDEQQ